MTNQMGKIREMEKNVCMLQADLAALKKAVDGRSPDVHNLVNLDDLSQTVAFAANEVGSVRDSLRSDVGTIASALLRIGREEMFSHEEMSAYSVPSECGSLISSRAQDDRAMVLRRHKLTADRWNRLVEERTSYPTGLRLGLFVYGVD